MIGTRVLWNVEAAWNEMMERYLHLNQFSVLMTYVLKPIGQQPEVGSGWLLEDE